MIARTLATIALLAGLATPAESENSIFWLPCLPMLGEMANICTLDSPMVIDGPDTFWHLTWSLQDHFAETVFDTREHCEAAGRELQRMVSPDHLAFACYSAVPTQ